MRPYASVSSIRPSYHPAGTLASVEPRINAALDQQRRKPLEVIGGFLAAAQNAQQQLARNPANDAARKDYNFAVARVIGTIRQASLEPWKQPLRVPAAERDFVLTSEPDANPQRNPARYDLTPADQLRFKGAYVRDHERKEGIGAPLVAIERRVNDHPQRDHMMPRIYYGVTAVIRFEGRRAVVLLKILLSPERSFRGNLSARGGFPVASAFCLHRKPAEVESSVRLSCCAGHRALAAQHVSLHQGYTPESRRRMPKPLRTALCSIASSGRRKWCRNDLGSFTLSAQAGSTPLVEPVPSAR